MATTKGRWSPGSTVALADEGLPVKNHAKPANMDPHNDVQPTVRMNTAAIFRTMATINSLQDGPTLGIRRGCSAAVACMPKLDRVTARFYVNH